MRYFMNDADPYKQPDPLAGGLAQYQQGLLQQVAPNIPPPPPQSAGILPVAPDQPKGFFAALLADPAKRAQLAGMSQALLQAGQWRAGPRMTGAEILGGAVQGAQQGQASWEEQQAREAAARLNEMMQKRKADLEDRKVAAEERKAEADWMTAQRGSLKEIDLGDRVSIRNESGQEIASIPKGISPTEAARIRAEAEQRAAADSRAAFGDATGLRKEVTQQLAPYKDSMDFADRLASTLDNYQPGISANAAVKLYNLMIEPTSVVRGEDFDAAIGTGGAFRSFVSSVKSLSEGMELPPNVRREMRRYADLYKQLAEQKGRQVASGYVRTAQAGGIDPILLQVDTMLGTPSGPAKQESPNNPAAW
jgi:hypothetical protein